MGIGPGGLHQLFASPQASTVMGEIPELGG